MSRRQQPTLGLSERVSTNEQDNAGYSSPRKWATVLIGLRSGLEGGAFTAFPDDTKISGSWR